MLFYVVDIVRWKDKFNLHIEYVVEKPLLME